MRFADMRELQTPADMVGLEMEFLKLRNDAERWRHCVAWVPAHERMPARGTECVVLLRYSQGNMPFTAIDTWDLQREDPTGMGGPTMAIGEGWNDNDENDVIAWLEIPPHPPAEWYQRLSE